MRPHSLFVRRFFSLAFWLAALAIGTLSLMPVQHLPSEVFDIWDKAQHAAGFAGLALLGRLAYPNRTVTLLFGLLGYGVAIEIAQSATGWRYGDVQDWLADALGVLAGLALGGAWVGKDWKSDADAQ
jgi:VanZ family protein